MRHTTILSFLFVLALAGTAPAVDSLNVRLIGFYHTATAAYGVDVSGDYAYIADLNGSLRVISTADPAHPFEVGHYDTTCSYSHVTIVKNDYVYLPDAGPGLLHVISIADPVHPVEVGSLSVPGWPGDIAVAGQYAYVANGEAVLVVSVADPANPVLVASSDSLGTAVSGVATSGDYVYAVDYDQGLEVISVVDPLHPVVVGHCDFTSAWGVAVSGSIVCTAGFDGMNVISVADPANPTRVGFIGTGMSYYMDLNMDGNLVYVADDPQGLRVISVADPSHPLQVGHYDESGQGKGVTLAGGYIFLGDGFTGLLILQYYESGMEEISKPPTLRRKLAATVVRSLPQGAVAFDAMGRRVLAQRPGVYFVRDQERGAWDAGRTRKVVVQH
jgi:hypothetical protein